LTVDFASEFPELLQSAGRSRHRFVVVAFAPESAPERMHQIVAHSSWQMSLKQHIHEFLGGSKMAALPAGAKAPAFTLRGTDGKKSSLAEALKKGPVVAAFFKVSCPTCQFTAPFLERLHEAYGGEQFTLWGISQDDAADTREFCREFEIDFPALIDEKGYPISNQYGITNVPTVFLIAPDGKIQESSVGFSKKDFEQIAAAVARATSTPPTAFFKPGEVIPDLKPG
jgi:peroxiredoxin